MLRRRQLTNPSMKEEVSYHPVLDLVVGGGAVEGSAAATAAVLEALRKSALSPSCLRYSIKMQHTLRAMNRPLARNRREPRGSRSSFISAKPEEGVARPPSELQASSSRFRLASGYHFRKAHTSTPSSFPRLFPLSMHSIIFVLPLIYSAVSHHRPRYKADCVEFRV